MAHIETIVVDSLQRDRDTKQPVPFREFYACSKCEGEIPKHSIYCLWCGVKFIVRH